MSEIKPRSMRMSDENYTRLQGLSEGRSLDETITFLLNTYDKDAERSGLGNQAVKLDELDEFLNAIRSQFAALLYTCQNAKEAVRTEYRKELEDKNSSIETMKDDILKLQKDMMRKNASAQEEIELLRSRLEDEKNKAAALESRVRDLEKTAVQKQQMIDSLSTALSSAGIKAEKLDATEKRLAESESAFRELRSQYTELLEDRNRYQDEALAAEKNYRKQQEETEKTLEKSKSDYEKLLEKDKADAQEQIERLRLQQELEIKTLRTESELAIREAQIQAQGQINAIKEEYQNKLFELMMIEKNQTK